MRSPTPARLGDQVDRKTYVNCPQCGTDNPEGARFCLNCGTRLAVVCPQCGATLPPQARFCFECGAQVGASPEEAQPPEQDTTATRLRRLVPKEYAERLLATRGQVGHERRTVTILFSDVKGSTAMAQHLDPEEVLEIMDGAFDVLIEPVYRYEGTLARLMGDAVLAFFGAPIAHEDDPERAIRAALEIIAGAREYAARLEQERGISDFNVRVGIHTGLVVVGEVGTDLRVEYTAMGDAVNLAARMEQSAPPGGILVTHDTYRHVRGVFDVQPQEPLLVKGRDEPVHTYLVQQAKPRAFRKPVRGVEGIETRMVGREAELKHLQEAFHTAVEDRELQVVTVSGEAGVGKFRLLHEFDIWSEALSEDFYYFKGRASRETQHLPYGLLRDLVAFRFQIQDSDPPATVRAKLEEGVAVALGEDDRSRKAAHLIGYLAGFAFGDSPHLGDLDDDPQATRDRALGCLGDYLRGMAGQYPVLILLEDLHWADDSSLDALNHLALALAQAPVLIAAAARPALFDRRPHWGEGQPFHTRLDLQPLSRWDSRRLVAEILQKVAEVPQALRALIVAGAEGNPFFIEELVKMLVEDGVIVKGEEAWRVAAERLAGVRVPPTLTGVLQARVDRLPPEERTVLQQASVVGRLFWDRAVARINESSGEASADSEVVEHLSALRRREMVFLRETSAFADAQEYLFKHALLREVTYESVLKRVRRAYHGLVADWLLEQGGERAGEYTGLVADHLALAGRAAEAIEHLLQAGDRARGLYAHQEAIDAYKRALDLLKELGEDRQAAQTLMKLGLTYHNAFDFRRSREAYEEGFALWQRASQAPPTMALPSAPHAVRVRWATTTLDSARRFSNASIRVMWHVFCGLVEITPEMDAVPDIAQSWDVLDGGRRYVFHLREDVVWSDGVPVTAGDFTYAWKRVLDPSTGSPNAELLYDVKGAKAFHQGQGQAKDVGVRAAGDRTLVVELEHPAGYFLQLLALTPATFPLPRHVLEARGEAWTEPGQIVTNGPFRLASWQPEESLVLVRDPAYHGRFTGNLERVELVFVRPEQRSALLSLYEVGELDTLALRAIPLPDRDRARRKYAGELLSYPRLGTSYLLFVTSGPPLDDVRVRRALVLATDRETLAATVLGGEGSPATGGLVPPGMPGHSPGIGLPYNPEGARQLLAEAGYAGGLGFPLVDAFDWSTEPAREGMRRCLQAQWQEKLGVEIRWQMLDLDALRQARRKLPGLFLGGWIADYPDPHNFLSQAAPEILRRWGNEAYDRLVAEASQVTDQAERMQLYKEADRMLIWMR